ncbi:gasdermin-A-like [Varanus komodoensis]|uniref:gasdermin-A-like n=1 Tax=Varanus komodoensis TaxID=61221 RepID=UPI001CF782D9|nr:gasdermin-A-like [Varanus komodoensis]
MAFHKATRSWIKQLDPFENWNHLQNVTEHEGFKLLCLVQKKRKILPWQTCSFKKTSIKLEDVLLSKDDITQLDIYDSGPYTTVDKESWKGKADGGGGAAIPPANMMGSASESHESCVTLKKRHIPVYKLVSLEGTINMDHMFIKQAKKSPNDLYVITEVIETMEDIRCEESIKAEGQFSLAADIIPKLNLQMGMQGNINSLKGITIPKAATVAFKGYHLLLGALRSKARSKIASVHRENKTEDLQIEMKEEGGELFYLRSDLCSRFLTAFVSIMKENDLLQELEFQLEQALEGTNQLKMKTDKPELQDLLYFLHDSEGIVYINLADSILYFLQALVELTELQLLLLAESVEKKIVSTQLALVGNILDSDFSEEEVDFTVDAQLVNPFTEEDLDLTTAMIEPTGVTVKKAGPGLAGTGDPEAYLALCPLYVALYILDMFQRKC